MASVGKSTLGGVAAGSTVGSAVPVIGTTIGAAVGAAVGAVVGAVSNVFGSKKHHAVYFWEDGTWKKVYTGQLPKAKAVEKQYKSAGYSTALVRDKNNTAKPPTSPPSGYVSSGSPAAGGLKNWLIAGGIAGVVLLVFVLIKKRR